MAKIFASFCLLFLFALVAWPATGEVTFRADLACLDERHGLPDSHWMPPEKDICSYSQVPPRWVCEEDPWCWCFWEWDSKNECFYLDQLFCA